jgi:hypothetical protein
VAIRSAWNLAACAAILAVANGCAHGRQRAALSEGLTFCAESSATLYVQNDNWLDMVLYAVKGGSRIRLGQVSAVNNAKFELPMAALGSGIGGIYILADPIGVTDARRDMFGRANMFATDDIALSPGHTIIDLRLYNVIDHSSYSVAVEDPEEI